MSLLSFLELIELPAILMLKSMRTHSTLHSAPTSQPKKSRIRKAIQKSAEDAKLVKMDALPNVFRSHHLFFSLMWFLVFLAFAALCVNFILGSVWQFTSNQVTTTVKNVQLEEAGEESAIQITFCNIIQRYLPDTQLISCMAGKKCTLNMFMDRLNGMCFSILTEEPYLQPYKTHGDDFQLHLILNAGGSPTYEKYVQGAGLNLGFNMFAENPSPYPLWTNPLQLTAGFGYDITVKRSIFEQHQWPYSNCSVLEDNSLIVDLEDRSLFDQTINSSIRYSQRLCIKYCTIYVNTFCLQNGDFYINWVCINQRVGNTTQNVNYLNYCYQRCPLECVQNVITKKASMYKYQPGYFDAYQNASLAYMPGNQTDKFIEIRVRFDTKSYLNYVEEPKMTGEDLLGVIGGHLHVFMGMSLLSFVEIAQLIVIILIRIVLSMVQREAAEETYRVK